MPEENNPCMQVLPGSLPCMKQIDQSTCALQKQGRTICVGKVSWAGADVGKARTHIAAKVLEGRHTTGQKAGHLSDALREETSHASIG